MGELCLDSGYHPGQTPCCPRTLALARLHPDGAVDLWLRTERVTAWAAADAFPLASHPTRSSVACLHRHGKHGEGHRLRACLGVVFGPLDRPSGVVFRGPPPGAFGPAVHDKIGLFWHLKPFFRTRFASTAGAVRGRDLALARTGLDDFWSRIALLPSGAPASIERECESHSSIRT